MLNKKEDSGADEQPEEVSLDLQAAFGAVESAAECFSIYIPNKDSFGNEFGTQRLWVLEACRLLSEINGGVTVDPPIEGGWMNPSSRQVVWENPVIVYSYIKDKEFVESLPRIREFLHRMGRETKQGEIAVQFRDRFYMIRQFDSPKEE
jgi:hypothetical protein